MRNEFIQAINQVCAERNLSQEVVIGAVEAALLSAYRRNFTVMPNAVAKLDQETGQVHVYNVLDVVEKVEDDKAQISIADALKLDPQAQVGGKVFIDNTPRDFGRIAAQTAKQVILQRIREAERDALHAQFAERVGEIITATVQSAEPNLVTLNLGKAEALLPGSEQIPGERYYPNMRLRVCILEVVKGTRGPEIIVTRANRIMLRRLLEMEVPEIFSGAVEIKGIAREAGWRSKVAVSANQPRLDPVGACVGQRGNRIYNIVTELRGEKIDIVAWSPDTATLIGNALSPAKPVLVSLDEHAEGNKTATVIVPDRQLSLAIGKEGQNVRLAAKLTGWRIDIKSVAEVAEEVKKAEEVPADISEGDLLARAEAILRARATARPVTAKAQPGQPVEVAPVPEPVEAVPKAEEVAAVAEATVVEMTAELAAEPDVAVVEEVPAVAETTQEVLVAAAMETVPQAAEAAPAGVPVPDEVLEVPAGVGDSEEPVDALSAVTKKAKKKSQALVFDEGLGRVVARKVRKPGRRRGWEEEEE